MLTAPTNEEAVEAWNGPLFDRWMAFRGTVATEVAPFSETTFAREPPGAGARVLDLGCGLGDTTLRLAELVGPDGAVTGVDAGERFIEQARREADEQAVANVAYLAADAQVADLGGPYDYAFSRFGTMFFGSPVAALRNVRSALAPGGRLCMIVWRNKVDNDWLHRGELVAQRFLERPEESDEPTCGPGPFSMANADTVTDILAGAGLEETTLQRVDLAYRLGGDLDQAIGLVSAIGPAGELLRLVGAEADEKRPQIEAALHDAYADLLGPDGVRANASAWIVTARAPAQASGCDRS